MVIYSSALIEALQRCAMKSLRYVASAMLAAGMMAGQPAAFATDSPPIQVAQPSNDLPAATLPTDGRPASGLLRLQGRPHADRQFCAGGAGTDAEQAARSSRIHASI